MAQPKKIKNTTTGPEGRFILIEDKREIRIVCFLYLFQLKSLRRQRK
jgi:hypothetical protein